MTVTHLNVGCGPHRAPEPWWNIDVVENDEVHPDEVYNINSGTPEGAYDLMYARYPKLERIYMGHVLEHLPWEAIDHVLWQAYMALSPGGEIAVCGPDVYKILYLWRKGRLNWSHVEKAIENETPYMTSKDWDGARHQWNCYPERVMTALKNAGFIEVYEADGPADGVKMGWPVVGPNVEGQLFIVGTRP